MSRSNAPWFHQSQRRNPRPLEVSVENIQDKLAKSENEVDAICSRVSRPTESSLCKRSLPVTLSSYMERGRHSWSKMELFSDVKKCMWSDSGEIKRTCKLRPTL
ncbi:hypothetical protein SNE40_016434 [Patella caerulea]|uniref:Uncharacterized protein n=1 Tax=Patella caerulea TaxID=87958 RepID=A0AAN8PNJ6_PATCE